VTTRVIRATAEQRAEYVARDPKPVYPLWGYVVAGGVKMAVEDLRKHWSKDDPQYEIIAPEHTVFVPDFTHTMLCHSLDDVKERAYRPEMCECESCNSISNA